MGTFTGEWDQFPIVRNQKVIFIVSTTMQEAMMYSLQHPPVRVLPTLDMLVGLIMEGTETNVDI